MPASSLLSLLGLALLFPSAVAVPGDRAPRSYRTEDVRYRNGDLILAALLMVPSDGTATGDDALARPAAVILQGSGSSDRSNPWSRAIAEELVDAGVVVLLTDKRGSGASEGDWQAADFGDLASDALAGVGFLRSRSEVDPDRVGLVGLSQGGWVAPLAAARSGEVAFVVDVSGTSVSFSEQSHHEMANTARHAGLTPEQVREVLALNRAAGEYLLTGDWESYERARNQGLQSEWGAIAAGFPDAPDAAIWTFLRGVMDYSPMPYWTQIEAPVLVLYGEEDEADNVPVAESVRRLEHAFSTIGKENADIVVVPGTGHAFVDPERHELVPAFVEALTGWIRSTVARPDRAVEPI